MYWHFLRGKEIHLENFQSTLIKYSELEKKIKRYQSL